MLELYVTRSHPLSHWEPVKRPEQWLGDGGASIHKILIKSASRLSHIIELYYRVMERMVVRKYLYPAMNTRQPHLLSMINTPRLSPKRFHNSRTEPVSLLFYKLCPSFWARIPSLLFMHWTSVKPLTLFGTQLCLKKWRCFIYRALYSDILLTYCEAMFYIVVLRSVNILGYSINEYVYVSLFAVTKNTILSRWRVTRRQCPTQCALHLCTVTRFPVPDIVDIFQLLIYWVSYYFLW